MSEYHTAPHSKIYKLAVLLLPIWRINEVIANKVVDAISSVILHSDRNCCVGAIVNLINIKTHCCLALESLSRKVDSFVRLEATKYQPFHLHGFILSLQGISLKNKSND